MRELKISNVREGEARSEALNPAHLKKSDQNPDRAVAGSGRIFMGYSHVRPTLQSAVKKNHRCSGPVTYLEYTEFGSLVKDRNGVVSITAEINGDLGKPKLPFTVFGVCDGNLMEVK
jgi:hypothetical protein